VISSRLKNPKNQREIDPRQRDQWSRSLNGESLSFFLSWVANTQLNHYTRWGRLRDRQHEQDSTSEKAHFISPHVLAAACVAGKPDRESQMRSGQSCGIKTGRLCTSQILKALSVGSAVTAPRHYLPALPSRERRRISH